MWKLYLRLSRLRIFGLALVAFGEKFDLGRLLDGTCIVFMIVVSAEVAFEVVAAAGVGCFYVSAHGGL